MNPFLVSVIIPVYNAEAYIKQAVESALTCEEVAEIILVEDHSPQNDWEVCQALQQQYPDKVKLYRTPQNMGAGAARNLGLKQVTQPFVAFLDADDVYLPHRFKQDAAVFAQNPQADAVYNALGQAALDDKGQEKLERNTWAFTCPLGDIRPEDLVYRCSPIGDQGHFSLVALTVKRSAIRTIGLFNKSLHLSQDTEWIIRLTTECKVYKGETSQAVAIRGLHENNRSGNKDKLERASLLMYQSLLAVGQSKQYPKALMRIFFDRYTGRYLKFNRGKLALAKYYVINIFRFPSFVFQRLITH